MFPWNKIFFPVLETDRESNPHLSVLVLLMVNLNFAMKAFDFLSEQYLQ